MRMSDSGSAVFERYNGAVVVVLGAAGFIGRWTARLLSGARARLHAVVQNPDQAASLRSDDLECEVAAFDICAAGALDEYLSRVKRAAVFNLAGYGVAPAGRDE